MKPEFKVLFDGYQFCVMQDDKDGRLPYPVSWHDTFDGAVRAIFYKAGLVLIAVSVEST